jgi:uncharacterized protein YjeT (DUF2065 family)
MMRTFTPLLYVCRSLSSRGGLSLPHRLTILTINEVSASFFVLHQNREEESAMWRRRLIEAFAIITVGDGLIEFLAPEKHSRLWVVGPESTRRIGMWFVEEPNRMRILGAAQVVLGVWLALRQHRDI